MANSDVMNLLGMGNANVANMMSMGNQDIMNLNNLGANLSMSGYQFPFQIGSNLAGYTPFAGDFGTAANPFSALAGIGQGIGNLFGTGTTP